MKKATNFRLSHQSLLLLAILEKKLHASKTAVIEASLQSYAEQKLKPQSALMAYAGILSKEDADTMLKRIHTDKKNKKLKVDL